MKRTLLLIILSLTSLLGLSAQNIRVSGTVLDSSSQPVYGAGVVIKGTSTGVTTDIDGKYEISVKPDAVLEFSFLGLATKTEAVAGRSTVNVIMSDDNTFLEAVVVVGYGTQKKGSITGAVSGLDGDNLIKTKNENPENMLT